MVAITNVKDAITTAIQMEKDGYNFYKKAAAQTTSDMGKSVFESIASDELVHLETFQKLFDETVGNQEWEHLVQSNKKYADLNVFPKDLKTMQGVEANPNELDALRIAMDSETEAIDYYTEIQSNTKDKQVKKILDMIIEQEKRHYFLLEQEFSHLSSTGYWYEFDYLGG